MSNKQQQQKKQNQSHKYREQTDGFQRGGGMGNIGAGERETQASSYGMNKSWPYHQWYCNSNVWGQIVATLVVSTA